MPADETAARREHPAIDGGGAVEVLTLEDGVDLSAPEVRRNALEALENGGLVFLPKVGFELIARERELLSDLRNLLAKQPEGANGRPTIIFEPARGRIKKFNFAYSGGKLVRAQIKSPVLPDVERMVMRFGTWAEDLIARLLPSYVSVLDRDRVTYRPNQRSAVQPLHVDSAYGYPTQGRGMLRIFCNIDPLHRPRIWQIGEPFECFARRFLPSVRLRNPGWTASMLSRLGFVGGAKTAYDMMIAELRRLGKRDAEYQRTAPRRIVEFPSGSSWLAITDLVLHGAVSGQHGVDQTFFLPAAGMRNPSRSSLRILERLSGRELV
jgi:hypothetical protein